MHRGYRRIAQLSLIDRVVNSIPISSQTPDLLIRIGVGPNLLAQTAHLQNRILAFANRLHMIIIGYFGGAIIRP